MERLLCQTQQDRGILADRVQHHGALELGSDLPHNMNAFGFEEAKMTECGH